MNKTIIYIIGAGRSGTTLIDVLLGNADSVFSAGELNRYPLARGEVRGMQEQPDRMEFWNAFGEDFISNFDLARQEQLHQEFEYHSGYVKRLLGKMDKNRYAEYQEYLRQFFALFFSSIEENIIIDSSKYPGRAIALSDTLPYKICYLYIKRDPVQVVKSFAKTDMFIPPKSWAAANMYYLSINHLCKIALRKLRKKHPVFEIRYEDIVSEPEASLKAIGEAFSLDLSAVVRKVAQDEYLQVGDLFAGNTMRMKRQIKLKRGTPKRKNSFRNLMTRLINLTVYQ